MFDLFSQPADNTVNSESTLVQNDVGCISGLQYIPNFIDSKEESGLVEAVQNEHWLADIRRRVQHYGYKYDYKARAIDYSMYLGPLPSWTNSICRRLVERNYLQQSPDQMIVNEYLPGQGIANHVDCEPCFGETIISISLCSSCMMDFVNVRSKKKIEVFLQPRSLVVINGDARHLWSHGIPARKSDFFNDTRFERQTRISITFRNVILKRRVS